MVREIRATQRAPVDDDASPDSVGEEVDEATASGTSPATHRVAFRDTAPPERPSSEQLSDSLISSVEGRARAAVPRLSGSQVRQVYRYIGRLRLLQELSREFAHYNDLCREPMAAALSPIRAMAFSGGGVLGTAYVGALLVLEEHGLDYGRIRRFAGASAGAIMAATLAVGFSDCARPGRAHARPRRQQRSAPGALDGASPQNAHRRRDITLGDVLQRYGKELIIVATELDTGRERKFNPHTDPQLPVKTAGHQYADGGLVNNWPVDCLPRDGTGMGIVAFTFTDYVCQDLFRLLWGHIPPERRVFDFERVGKSFAKVLYTHPERAESMFAVAKQSLRVIYDRLTKEQLWTTAHAGARVRAPTRDGGRRACSGARARQQPGGATRRPVFSAQRRHQPVTAGTNTRDSARGAGTQRGRLVHRTRALGRHAHTHRFDRATIGLAHATATQRLRPREPAFAIAADATGMGSTGGIVLEVDVSAVAPRDRAPRSAPATEVVPAKTVSRPGPKLLAARACQTNSQHDRVAVARRVAERAHLHPGVLCRLSAVRHLLSGRPMRPRRRRRGPARLRLTRSDPREP
eukprot:ctg_377.g230